MESASSINDRARESSAFVQDLFAEIRKVIVGQQRLVERLLIGLLTNGHVLLEGVPGLAKTLAVKSLAAAVDARFQRIQFTPDLLPADLIGTLIYNPSTGSFTTRMGPIFANIVLADEVNRAPAKVQSALLEAMEERQVTIGDTTYQLDEPFLVLATQNPLEQQGTYPLPEAQLDRFMMKVNITYPTKDEEKEILSRMARVDSPIQIKPVVSLEDIMNARKVVDSIYIDDKIKDYIVDIVFATRKPSDYGVDMDNYVEYGASPRASIFLTLAAKAYAFIQGRGYVVPHDVKSIGMDVLRHRVVVNYEAEAEGISSEDLIRAVFDRVETP
ncbi:MAG: MoxR family ATPase [Bacillota bacterium]|nr:MoxR family ATPase [Bacillota bacterium]HOB90934.1 MoxR family ATPase [Bacillota bacterium]HPZ55018.1 MoxR family ATPase [Bacillota bacterium]HQD17963.1 MoxR family ATPase [Bacillota bacterium]